MTETCILLPLFLNQIIAFVVGQCTFTKFDKCDIKMYIRYLVQRTPKIWPPFIINGSVTCCQAASLRQLEEENHEAAARLEEVVSRGDMLLEKIQSALADIAQSQLRTRNGAPSQPSAAES